jgi:hypothetical protein
MQAIGMQRHVSGNGRNFWQKFMNLLHSSSRISFTGHQRKRVLQHGELITFQRILPRSNPVGPDIELVPLAGILCPIRSRKITTEKSRKIIPKVTPMCVPLL